MTQPRFNLYDHLFSENLDMVALEQDLRRLSPSEQDFHQKQVARACGLEDQRKAIQIVRVLLKVFPKWVNSCDHQGDPGVVVAAKKGHASLYELLVAHGANPKKPSKDGLTALQACIRTCPTENQGLILKAVLCSARFSRAELANALLDAVDLESESAVRTLLEAGADFSVQGVNTQGHSTGNALARACFNADLYRTDRVSPLVQELLASPKVTRHVLNAGWENTQGLGAPIHCAAYQGSLAQIQLLMKKGASLAPPPRLAKLAFRTPLMAACEGINPKMVAFLLEQGVDPTATDHQGRTALHHLATAESNDVEEEIHLRPCLDLLLATHLDPLARDADGHTAGDVAKEHGHENMARQLLALQLEANLSAGPHRKTTPRL